MLALWYRKEKKSFVTEVSIEIFSTLEKWDGKLKKKNEVNSDLHLCFFLTNLEKGAVAFYGSKERDLDKWNHFCIVSLG